MRGPSFFVRIGSGFTLIELLVVIAVIAVVAAILFPVFGQARGSARKTACLSNTRQTVMAALQYAQDYDETFPRLDNNGDCSWDEPGCSLPDSGNPGTDPDVPPRMFWNVLQAYIKNQQIGYCPEIGKTDWQGVIANGAAIFEPWGYPAWGLYNPGLEQHYYGAAAQMAVNSIVIDFIPPSAAYHPSIRAHPRGRLAGIQRPSEVLLLVGDSVWDNGTAASLGLGNSIVWPNEPGSVCPDAGQGWTWYVHKPDKRRFGSRAEVESGWANVAMCDGHVKNFRYSQLEHCDYPTGNPAWPLTFRHWDPQY
jgi:prepilin-type N-terminal cleavage/methylation domain-containing protein/prepilin-type processing-associated H-X9-DG protein